MNFVVQGWGDEIERLLLVVAAVQGADSLYGFVIRSEGINEA